MIYLFSIRNTMQRIIVGNQVISEIQGIIMTPLQLLNIIYLQIIYRCESDGKLSHHI